MLLALLSFAGYVLAEAYSPLALLGLDLLDGWTMAGVAFGVLVMGPYVARQPWPLLRVLACMAASPFIYRMAVDIATEGPLGQGTRPAFVSAGAGAALLVAGVILLLAPARFRWPALPLTLLGGALGGLSFTWFVFGQQMYEGHLAWQLLVCLALHFGLRQASEPAAQQ